MEKFRYFWKCLAVAGMLISCSGNPAKEGTNPYSGIKAASEKDSLLQVVRMPGKDSFHVRALNSLCVMLRRDNPDTGIILGNEAVRLAEEIGYQAGLTRAHSSVATAYRLQGDYANAITHNEAAYEIAAQLRDSFEMQKSVGALGAVYYVQANYPRAIDYYFEALALAEGIRDSTSIALHLSNIGGVFLLQENPDSAVRFFRSALAIDKAQRDTIGISYDVSGIASAFGHADKHDSALYFFNMAYQLEQAGGTKYGAAVILGNIGFSWCRMGELAADREKQAVYYDSAVACFERTLLLEKEVDDIRSTALTLNDLARVYIRQGRYNDALPLLARSLHLADSLGLPETIKDAEVNYTSLYDSLNDPAQAYIHYKNSIVLRDSLINSDKTDQMTRAQLNFDFEKERAVQKAKTDEELARQQLFRNSAITGALLLLIVAAVSIRAYRTKKRSTEIISAQKLEVENQKALVESKQKEIVDSINYAQRIQNALFPAERKVQEVFGECFVLFMPKDIVSGDFYWMEKAKDGTALLAAVDCTGHGVPGALVSVVGNNALNRSIREYGLSDPGKILDKLNELVTETFEQNESEVKDGMDISLLALRKKENSTILQWAGANNNLWYIRNGILTELKADRQPIGKFDNRKSFTTHTVELMKGDAIYIFTDGFADQFGGPKGKKFKQKALQDLLITLCTAHPATQKLFIQKAFNEWRGELDQVDDVLIIGLKI